jgi:Ca2+-binding EF-hand superfamily protein
LSDFLRKPLHHLTLRFRLSDKANLSDVEAVLSGGAESFCQLEKTGRGRLMLRLDGMRIQLVARGGGANDRMMSRGYVGQEFSLADTDRSQELSEEEFTAMSASLSRAGAGLEFSAADLDGNGGVSRKELFGVLESEQAVVAGRVEITVEQSGKTMFSILDSNSDLRLTRREIQSGQSRLQQFDLNSDGLFSELELGTEYVLSVGMGRSEYRRSAADMAMNPAMMSGVSDAVLPGVENLSGPLWFRRMDRNQDGDVSLREFPGTSAQFQQLDSDADGLISTTEAEAVEAGK